MDSNNSNLLWLITEMYPEAPEKCHILNYNDNGTFNMQVGHSDVYDNCTKEEPFKLYDSYESAELALIHSIYNELRNGTGEFGMEYKHVNYRDDKVDLEMKYEHNYNLLKKIFNQVYDNVIQCYMTAFTCGNSLRVFIDEVGNAGFNRLIAKHAFRFVVVINDYVVDPDIIFFPITLKKYKWMLSRLNQGEDVCEISSMHRIVSWEKEIV